MKHRCSYISPEGQSLIVVAKERGGTTEGDVRAISDRHQCKADATWGVYRCGANPLDPKFSCVDHVGRILLQTGEYRVVPIAACPMLSIVKTTVPVRPSTGMKFMPGVVPGGRGIAPTISQMVAQRAAAEDRAVLDALCRVYGFSALTMERLEHHGSYIITARRRDGTVEHCAEERIPILKIESATDVWDISLHYLDRLARRLGASRPSRHTVEAAAAAARSSLWDVPYEHVNTALSPEVALKKFGDYAEYSYSFTDLQLQKVTKQIQSAIDRKINDAITAKVKF